MFDNVIKFFKKFAKNKEADSKDTAKERLHLVLMQDRANVSADFLELMKQEIIDVIKKYIDVDETSIDVRLTNKTNGDGTTGAPALYANIPIVSIKDENKNKVIVEDKKEDKKVETDKKEQKSEKDKVEEKKEADKENEKQEEIKQEEKAEVKEEKTTEGNKQIEDEEKTEVKQEETVNEGKENIEQETNNPETEKSKE